MLHHANHIARPIDIPQDTAPSDPLHPGRPFTGLMTIK
jgi:hypothetical protein